MIAFKTRSLGIGIIGAAQRHHRWINLILEAATVSQGEYYGLLGVWHCCGYSKVDLVQQTRQPRHLNDHGGTLGRL